jgi:8-oxo-dGTP diphosphatase
VLVRHAKAGERATWRGDDKDRPLTERGEAQALWLVTQLGDHDVRRLVSSPYARCVQTLDPLARALGRPVEHDTGLAEGAGHGRALALLAEPGSVVCTHGDVIAETLEVLRARGLEAEGGDGLRKGALWIVDGARLRYLPPPV